jgi:antirestriction protein ArdC
MSSHENTAPKADVYRKVTDAIVDAIESGIGHYQMLWTVRQERGFGPISVGSVKVAA